MKNKKAICLLVFFIIAAGCLGLKSVPVTARVSNRVRLLPSNNIDNHYTLGSSKYINEILQIANKSGYNVALHRVMSDVEKYGGDIDTNDYNTNLQFYRLVSCLLSKIGHVDEDVHYFRNKLNRAPKTLNDLLRVNSELPSSRRWRLLTISSSLYHLQGKDGIYNLKFISSDGFCEAVYNKNGILLNEKNDPVNMGTFNYAAGIKEINAHEKYDVIPYLKWGNTPDSPQKGAKAVNTGLKLVEKQYNEHSTSVAAYRKKVMSSYSKKV